MKFCTGERSGSASVLFVVIFSAMLVLAAALFAASQSAAAASNADAALRLGARSVLSEYDTALYNAYGLMGFRSDEKQIERDIAFYAGAGLGGGSVLDYALFSSDGKHLKSPQATPDITAYLKEHALTDCNLFEKGIAAAAPLMIVEQPYKKGAHVKNMEGASDKKDDSKHHKRTLRRSSVLNSLPTKDFKGSVLPDIVKHGIPSLDDIADKTSKLVLVNEYIMSVFGRANDGIYLEDHFYDYEVEYILVGSKTESTNYNTVKLEIGVLRQALNSAHILADSKKRTVCMELAAPGAALFGVGELLALAVIVEAWAGAETTNDLALLEAGKNVALWKTEATWATGNPADIVKGILPSKIVKPKSSAGQSYSDYLRLFLYIQNRETKLTRMMDLIQINMRGTYDATFSLRECYTGFSYGAEIGNRVSKYEETY